jgi:hypothetical protein
MHNDPHAFGLAILLFITFVIMVDRFTVARVCKEKLRDIRRSAHTLRNLFIEDEDA